MESESSSALSADLYRFVYGIPGTDSEELHIAATGWVDSLERLQTYVEANADSLPPWSHWKAPHGKLPENKTIHRIYSVRRPGFMYRMIPSPFFLPGKPGA